MEKYMDEIEEFETIKLLEKFIIDNEKLEQLEDRLAGFNIFEAIGMKTQEIKHSQTLAFLLDPKNGHGFGQYFLKKLLKDITKDQISNIGPIDIDCEDLSDTEVRCEWKNIDILIICHSAKFVISIENKILASESEHQLQKYKRTVTGASNFKYGNPIIEGEFKSYNPVFVFLTVEGDKPKERNGSDVWLSYSHINLINILEKSLAAQKHNLGIDQSVLVRHYIELMRRHVLTDSDIASLAREIYLEHNIALDKISSFIPNDIEIFGSHIKDLIHSSDQLVLEPSSLQYIRFSHISWQFSKNWVGEHAAWKKKGVLFEIHFKPSLKKITLMLVLGNLENTRNQKKMCELIAKKLLTSPEESRHGHPRAWKREPVLELSKHKTDVEVMNGIKRKTTDWWDEFITNDMEEVCLAVKDTIHELHINK